MEVFRDEAQEKVVPTYVILRLDGLAKQRVAMAERQFERGAGVKAESSKTDEDHSFDGWRRLPFIQKGT